MKNKNPFILIAIVIIAVIVVFFGGKAVITKFSGGKVKETQSGIATINQAFVTVNVFGWDSDNNKADDTAVLLYTPLINITTTKEMKKFEIRNVKLTNDIKGKKFVTWPKAQKQMQTSNWYYETMETPLELNKRKDEGNNFEYKVVDTASNMNEIGKNGGIVDFKYTVWDLGKKFNSEEILNKDGSFSTSKALQYSGFKLGDINSPIEFDVVITFADKTKAVKHFSLTTDFNELYNQGYSFVHNDKEYVGKTF